MLDDKTHQDRTKRNPHLAGLAGILQSKEGDAEEAESSGRAFGYLRGIGEAAAAVEFKFRDGNSLWFPYSWLGNWQHNPSEGLLLKFSGDVVYLVLIRGSNLGRPLGEGAINLTSGGLQRHRILWIREMTPEQIQEVGETGPTIDSIEVAELGSREALKEWIKQKAPGFLQTPA